MSWQKTISIHITQAVHFYTFDRVNKSVQAQIENKWRQAITLKYTSLNAYRVSDISFRKYGDSIISVLANYQVHNRLWNVMELQCFTNQIMMHLPESVLQVEQRDNELFLLIIIIMIIIIIISKPNSTKERPWKEMLFTSR